jgi:hypothetical protein
VPFAIPGDSIITGDSVGKTFLAFCGFVSAGAERPTRGLHMSKWAVRRLLSALRHLSLGRRRRDVANETGAPKTLIEIRPEDYEFLLNHDSKNASIYSVLKGAVVIHRIEGRGESYRMVILCDPDTATALIRHAKQICPAAARFMLLARFA